jgi:indolepyruvate ferredoxin oxidoreductase
MLGFAWQKGVIPVSSRALYRAIRLNGVEAEANLQAFELGRKAAFDPQARGKREDDVPTPETMPLDELINGRAAELRAYQNDAYADRYLTKVGKVRAAEAAFGTEALTRAVAVSLYKLMAYKDEYEVARLYTDGAFLKQLRQQFEGDYRLQFHLAPPLLAERDPATGHLKKRAYGPWMLKAFALMARLKGLRGTVLDPFGRSEERRRERAMIGEYERLVEELLSNLTHDNHPLAVEIARLPLDIRGFGHVLEANYRKVKAREGELLAAFRAPQPAVTAAE